MEFVEHIIANPKIVFDFIAKMIVFLMILFVLIEVMWFYLIKWDAKKIHGAKFFLIVLGCIGIIKLYLSLVF